MNTLDIMRSCASHFRQSDALQRHMRLNPYDAERFAPYVAFQQTKANEALDMLRAECPGLIRADVETALADGLIRADVKTALADGLTLDEAMQERFNRGGI